MPLSLLKKVTSVRYTAEMEQERVSVQKLLLEFDDNQGIILFDGVEFKRLSMNDYRKIVDMSRKTYACSMKQFITILR